MRIILILLITSVLFTRLNAQRYVLTTSTSTYTELTNATSLTQGSTWDDPAYSVPIGFEFTFYDTSYSSIYFDPQGLGCELTFSETNTGISGNIYSFGADLIDRAYNLDLDELEAGGLSEISYKTEGTTGFRILKIEWKNAGFYSDIDEDGVSTDYVNVQLWLYELTGAIEIHLGPSSISNFILSFDGAPGPFIGLLESYNYDTYELEAQVELLSGPAANPSLVLSDDIYDTFITGIPTDGSVYVLNQIVIGSSYSLEKSKFETVLYPNPTLGNVKIQTSLQNYSATLINTQGEIVLTIPNSPKSLDLSPLALGVYLIQLKSKSGTVTKRLVKS